MDDRNETLRADNRFIRRIMRQSLLERDDELKLAKSWRDNEDERALHQLVLAYSRLVVSIASKFRHYGLPLGDLIQEGNIGIMQAASRFDPNVKSGFQPIPSGGFAPQSRIMSCATGRLCAPARHRRINPFSSNSAVCGPESGKPKAGC